MRLRGSGPWQIHVDEWIWLCELALWLRAAEAINVPAGGLVPGPLEAAGSLDAPVLPSPTAAPESAAELSDGWLAWWHALLRQPRPQPPVESGRPPVLPAGFDSFAKLASETGLNLWPPEFPGLRPWPSLRDVAMRRWPEAHRWHTTRAQAAIAVRSFPSLRESEAVRLAQRRVRRQLHRRLTPFRLELMVVPVRDDEIRRIAENRYLVPERVYAGGHWPQLLEALIVRADAVAA